MRSSIYSEFTLPGISHGNDERLNHEARTHSMKTEDYSCTLSGVLEDSENGKMIYFSTGDSIIMAVPESESERILIPARPKDFFGWCVA